jgi:enoyl-CoA hydratase/carnithine racemase
MSQNTPSTVPAPPVDTADHGAIRVITVNRPDKLNALNGATLDALHLAFDAAADDPAVRVVVLTGAGPQGLRRRGGYRRDEPTHAGAGP